MTLYTQFVAMGAMIVGGIYLGMANETLRRFAPYWQRSVVLTYGIESLFWLIQTGLLYYALFQINYGELRLYLFVALIFGFLCYQQFFRTVYKTLLEFGIKIVKSLLLILYKIIIVPILYIVALLRKLCLWLLRILLRLLRWLLLGLILRPIVWLMPKRVRNFMSQRMQNCSTMVSSIASKGKAFFSTWRR